MSIKPVAWMYQRVDCEDCSLSFQKWPDEDVTESWREEPLYAIPDTHRLVPVELLEQIAVRSPTTGLAWDKELRAIIEDKENKQ